MNENNYTDKLDPVIYVDNNINVKLSCFKIK